MRIWVLDAHRSEREGKPFEVICFSCETREDGVLVTELRYSISLSLGSDLVRFGRPLVEEFIRLCSEEREVSITEAGLNALDREGIAVSDPLRLKIVPRPGIRLNLGEWTARPLSDRPPLPPETS